MDNGFAYPARVLVRPTTDELMDLVWSKHALDTKVLADHPPFFFGAEISSNRLDAYFTRMAVSSLRNFAADAREGVSLQDSHNPFALAVGRSLTGQTEHLGNGVHRVVSDFYIIPGLRLSTPTDDVILGIRSGIVSDVSVGFYGGMFRCALCQRDLWDWDCPHIPGVEYPIRDDSEAIIGQEIASAWIEDARLAEVSVVYEGATPGATILKAQDAARNGRLAPEVIRLLEARYRMRLPDREVRVFTGPGVPVVSDAPSPISPPVTPVPDRPTEDPMELDMDKIRQILGEASVSLAAPDGLDAALQQVVGQVHDLTAERDRLAARIKDLEPQADDGRKYRAHLIEETINEGIRAFGNDFPAETFRGMLAGQTLDGIRQMLEHHRAAAGRLFAPGRQTVDAVAEKPTENTDQTALPDLPGVPDDIYRA